MFNPDKSTNPGGDAEEFKKNLKEESGIDADSAEDAAREDMEQEDFEPEGGVFDDENKETPVEGSEDSEDHSKAA